MKVATTHIERLNMEGFARCFRLSEPREFGGTRHDYVNVWIAPGNPYQNAEMAIFPATSGGAVATTSLRKRAGLTVLDDFDKSDDYVNGLYLLALTMLGYGYVSPEDFPEVDNGDATAN